MIPDEADKKRARRRRDLQRMKAKARRLYPHDPRATNANHLTVCSCYACGNQRRYSGPTLAEIRVDAAARQDLQDL